jgi:isopenicillin-N N-acyltransferase-like protein
VIDGPGPHTNHYTSEDLQDLAPAPSEGSLARYERLQTLLEDPASRSVEGLMGVMRDHESGPQAVCLHPDPEEGDEASACMFSMIADVEARRMWVAPGNPCVRPYEEIDLAPLAR